MASENYRIIRDAIANKLIVYATYDGYPREMCPHVIGKKGRTEQALFFQFGGRSSTRLPPGGGWKCMEIGRLKNVRTEAGQWRTANTHSSRQTCVDDIDLEVDY